MRSVCCQCQVREAVKVLGGKQWCEQCAAVPTMFNPELPTINRLLDVQGETRTCTRCKELISATIVTCPNCNFSELSLVDLPAEEEKKQVVPQSVQLGGDCRCWKCPNCAYEYNQDKTCFHCRAQRPRPEPTLPPQRNVVSLPVGPKLAKGDKVEPLDARAGDDSSESEDFSKAISCEKCGAECHCVAQWECVCNSKNPIYVEACERCSSPYETSVKSPWKCINCANRTSIMVCDQCGCGKGWSQFLKHHKVEVNNEGWMWRCKACYLWNSYEVFQCFCGEENKVIKGGLQGIDNRSLKKSRLFGIF